MAVIGSAGELLARASARTEVRPGDRQGRGALGAGRDRRGTVFRQAPQPGVGLDHAGHRRSRPPSLPGLAVRTMDRSPASIDHTAVAMQVSGAGDDAVLTMLM